MNKLLIFDNLEWVQTFAPILYFSVFNKNTILNYELMTGFQIPEFINSSRR